ncbi:MAG: hypothetical protein II581_08385, partial [Oscillospiraceae bacterium]|nr:hypothetical protein [Oscillospiraceae bacterium]
MTTNRDVKAQIEALYQDSAIRDRKYYPDFRRAWNSLLEAAASSEEEYFPPEADSVITIHSDYGGLSFDFHLDQKKMADWYDQEVRSRKRVVFVPKRFRRSRSGQLSFHESLCRSYPELPEPALAESDGELLWRAAVSVCSVTARTEGDRITADLDLDV